MDGPDRDLRVDVPHPVTGNSGSEHAAYERIWELAQLPEFDPDQVVELVIQNDEITKRLLRVANSSMLGVRRRVTDLRQAVLILGSGGMAEFARPRVTRRELDGPARAVRADAAEPPGVRRPWSRETGRPPG